MRKTMNATKYLTTNRFGHRFQSLFTWILRYGRAGGLVAKVASMEDVTYYFAVLELDDDTLDTKWLTLAANKPCQWSVKSEGGQTTLKIVSGATEVASLSAATEKVKGYGFAATVREKGNEADLTVTFN